MPTYKLIYFAGRGRGEAIRLAAAYGGIDLEDARFSGPALMAAKADGSVKPPYGQFPYIEVDGVPVAQSATCLRFIAKRAGLYPADDVAAAQAESVVEQANDVASAIYPAIFGDNADAKAAAMSAAMGPDGKVARMGAGIVAYLGDKPFLFGDKPCLADISVFALVEGFRSYGVDIASVLPALGPLADRVAALPQLAAYFTKRAAIEAAEKQ